MVRLPCGEVCAVVCFCVNFVVVVRIGVRHGVFLRIVEKICGWDLGRSVLTWVFDPRVVRLGDGRVHAYHDFVSGWLGRHRFRRTLVLLRELVRKVDHVGDQPF